MNNDIDQYFKKYPVLEEIAELGVDLETLGGSEYAKEVLQEIQNKLQILKDQIYTNNK